MPSRTRVLVVEHDAPLAQLCEELLEEEGFEVHLATHGGMALSVLDTVRPDIVLLELMMPFLDGFAFLKALAQRPGARPPVIAMSSIPAYVEAARQAGARDVLQKPFSTQTLVAMLRGSSHPPLTLLSAAEGQEESDRLRAVLELRLPEREASQALQSFVRRVAGIFECPIGLVSLITEARQHFHVHCGLPDDLSAEGSADRRHSFCTHSVAGRSALIVQDTFENPFFSHNPLVRERGIRFYAGVPVFSRLGAALGTLCLLDFKPHWFTYFDLELLSILAKRVASELQRREGDGVPDVPPAVLGGSGPLGHDLHVLDREQFTDALALQSARCAERRVPLALGVLATEGPPTAVARQLEAVFPLALTGRLGLQTLGILITGVTAARVRGPVLEAAGPGTSLVMADLSGLVNVPEQVLHRCECALGYATTPPVRVQAPLSPGA